MRDDEQTMRYQLRLDLRRVLAEIDDPSIKGDKSKVRQRCREALDHIDVLERFAKERRDAAP